MFCSQCGATLQPAQRFCANCGTPLGSAAPFVPGPIAPPTRVAGNIKLLAILWMVVSGIRLIPGLFMVTVLGGAASILPEEVPAFVPALLHGIGVFIIAGAAIGLLAGWGLLEHQPWARMLAIVLGFLSLIEPPFGTAIGIYTLWVLLPAQSETEYRQLAFSDPAR